MTTTTLTAPAAADAPAAAPALAIDIETYSPVDLSKAGVYRYTEDEAFQVLLFSYALGDAPVEVVDLTKRPLPDDLLDALTDPAVTKTAFNANFERVCLSRYLRDLGKLPEGTFLDPTSWHCTMVHAATLGLPRSLDGAARALGAAEKMSEGKALIKRFSIPCKPKKRDDLTYSLPAGEGKVRWLPASDPEAWETFKDYCARDVGVERAVRQALDAVPVPDQLWAEYAADQRICDRGLAIDLDLVEAAQGVDAEHREELTAELAELTGLDNPRSVIQFRTWLAERGYDVASVDKSTMAATAQRAEAAGDNGVARACRLRPAIAAASSAKYAAMQARASPRDGRARGTAVFFGAHTGRWAGRGIQTQNLAHTPDVDLHAAREAMCGGLSTIRDAGLDPAELVGGLVRTAIVPGQGCRLVAADYASIEARVLAWMAGETAALRTFLRGEDIYCATASQMYGVTVEKNGENGHLRALGKIAVLGCGYGASWRALQAMNPDIREAQLREVVSKWRSTNPRIVNFWGELEAACRTALASTAAVYGYRLGIASAPSITGRSGARDLLIQLPSGRVMRYVDARIEPQRSGPREGEMSIHFTDARGRRASTYGGKLVENVTQAIARDLLADALVRAEAAGVHTVFHVHDEIVAEARDEAEADALVELMEEAPAWAAGLPLAAEAETLDFYRK
ncbi:DNA polymerase [Corynebacterium sp. P3-F1]|uniref:DNA polymerase n=1 Tax=Corynebacterium sp. P3-F1 TaxID=3059080 RepID=UPI00265C9D7E|nr:DNA polymerase [Corynebacterium sp. P3-F1]WKK61209.1 DNA polymerase [Corynebacterium sp. P3-F1]